MRFRLPIGGAHDIESRGARENGEVLQTTFECEGVARCRQREIPAVSDTATFVDQRKISPISFAGEQYAAGYLLAEDDAAEGWTPELQFDAAGRVGPRQFEVDAAGVGREKRRVFSKVSARDAGQFHADWTVQLNDNRASVRSVAESVWRGVVDEQRPRR